MSKKIMIIGGVAGGATCAARARRLSEEAEIIVLERGPYVSFANCGLPYYVGNVIKKEESLLVATPELFKNRFNIDVRPENEVLSIDKEKQEVEVKDNKTGKIYRESYDSLVLAPGSFAIHPPLPGIDLPGIFTLKTIPDTRKINDWIKEHNVKKAVIVGGGFIGLEMAENLVNRGIAVTVVEMSPHVMPPFDREMVAPVHEALKKHGVELALADGVAGFESKNNAISVRSSSGRTHEADMVILSIGVRPETKLAKGAGLTIGERGGIRVDEQMRTSDSHIWAVGDAVEVRDYITGEWTIIPLANPANRQGRVAADALMGRDTRYRGVQATAVCGLFGITAASTGASEKVLQRAKIKYEKVYLHPSHHVNYYPGAKMIELKVLFSPDDGRVLGAQAVGEEGVEKRIDVLAMAIQKGATVFDLEEAELCYAPQYGAAKDPVNMAGMIAANSIRGDAPLVHWADMEATKPLILDVREPYEHDAGHVPGSVNISLNKLRDNLDKIPKDRPVWLHCRVGQRSYYGTRILRLSGFDNAYNISGGYLTYEALKAEGMVK